VSAHVCAALLLLACSEPVTADDPGDDRLFVPEGLANTELDGEGGLTLVAFTLQQRASGLELLATIRHDGDEPACQAGILSHFIDRAGVLQATVSAAIYGGGYYRLDDEAGTLVRCLGPGQLGMAALVDLPDAVVLDHIAHLQHSFPAFTLAGLSAVDGGLELSVLATDSGYAGTLTNELGVPVADPEVAVFPVNRVNRALGVATNRAQLELLPGEEWRFAATLVTERGVDQVAHASVSITGDRAPTNRE
jgi:hypothetical protein